MKVLLADQKINIRYGLMVLLREQPELEILGDTDNTEDLLLQIRTGCPDLVLLGWGLPGLPTEDLLAQIRTLCPQIRVIALSEKAYLREKALAAGADAFMCKGDPPEKLLSLLQGIRKLVEGEGVSHYPTEIRYSSDIEIH